MRKFLLYSSALAVLGLSGMAEAACIQTPTCSSLGYTSTSSCTGGVKCPFGNYWNCTASDLNDKITELEKTIEDVQQNSDNQNVETETCKVGDILFSDMSCAANPVSGKTPIGVIFDSTNNWAIGLNEAEKSWGDYRSDIPGIPGFFDVSDSVTDFRGLNNTLVAIEYCKQEGIECPAFEYVNTYKTEGTQAGDWYLPAAGQFNTIYEIKGILNRALEKIGGTKLGTGSYWSSSEQSDNRYAWILGFYNGSVDYNYKYSSYYVRPALAFQALMQKENSPLALARGEFLLYFIS